MLWHEAHFLLPGIVALLLLGSILRVSGPLVLKYAIDAASLGQFEKGQLAIVIYAAVDVASRVTPAVLSLSLMMVFGRIQKGTLQLVYGHVLDLPYAFHSQRRLGELSRTISDGLNGIRSVLQAIFLSSLPVLLEVGAIFGIVATFYDPTMLAILMIILLLYGILFHRGTIRQQKLLHTAINTESEVANITTDALLNYETIKHFGGERTVAAQITAALSSRQSAWLAVFRSQAENRFALGTPLSIGIGALLYLVLWDIIRGTMTPGDFVLVIAYTGQIIVPIERLSTASRDYIQGMTYVEQLTKILDEPDEMKVNAGRCPLTGSGPLTLTVEDLHFRYQPDRTILRGVSFTVPAGRTCAIVGISGSGKSTVLRLLFGFYPPESGRILINGIPIGDLDLTTLRQAIAIVPQDAALFNDSIAANIAFARPDATKDEIGRAATQAGLDPMLNALPDGWNTIVGERGVRLSGGERQRLAIARAILKRPRIFVFDEATSSLDSKTERLIQDNILLASRGVTTLIITHRLSTIQDADEILVLHEGKIVEKGSHGLMLAAASHYSTMWSAQQKLVVEDQPQCCGQ
jgi:ATP-binding cassette subfamily B protein